MWQLDELVGVAKQSTSSSKRKRGDIRGYFTRETSDGGSKKKDLVADGALAKPDSKRPSAKKLKLASHTKNNTASPDKYHKKVVSTFGAWNVNSLCSRLRQERSVQSIRTFLAATEIDCFFLSEVKVKAAGPHQWRPSNCADKKAAQEYELIQKHFGKGGAFEVVSCADNDMRA